MSTVDRLWMSSLTLEELCTLASFAAKAMRSNCRGLATIEQHDNLQTILANGARIIDELLIHLQDKVTLERFQNVTHANLQAKVNQSIDEVTERERSIERYLSEASNVEVKVSEDT